MRALPLSLILAGIWLILAGTGLLEPIERLTVQVRYGLRPTGRIESPVSVVAIDEKALARYGQMPWDRRRFAALLDRLGQAGADAVGIDVGFTEPSTAAADAALEAAMRRVPTVLPAFLAYAGAGGSALTVVEPLPRLAAVAAGQGSVQLSRQQQVQLWEFEPYQDLGDRRLPAFPVAVLAAGRGAAWPVPRHGFPWRAGPLLINFQGPATSVDQRSVVDLLEGPLPDLHGRVVLVGATASGLPDTNFAVPDMRKGPMAGVEAFAHVIDNVRRDAFWRRLSLPALAVLLGLLALGPGRWLLAPTLPGRRHLAWAALTLAWLAAAMAAFYVGVWLEVVPVLGFMFSAYFGGLLSERASLLVSRNRLLERYASDLASESQRQRDRLEGELHDGVQQLLLALGREVRRARRPLDDASPTAERLLRAEDIAAEAIAEIERLRQDLLPPALRRGGLQAALPALAEEIWVRDGLAVRVEESRWVPLAAETESELYWMVREALNNAIKHAEANSATVRLGWTHRGVLVEVHDDGRGFTPPDLSLPSTGTAHSGLHRMWLRMRGRGGDLTLQATPGRGTMLRFWLPAAAIAERKTS